MATLQAAETFQTGTNLAQISTSNTSFDNVSPSPTDQLIFSNERALPGLLRSMKVDGATASRMGVWTLPSHVLHRHITYWYIPNVPPGTAAIPFYQARDGADAAVAMQVRVSPAGLLELRNVTTIIDTGTCPIGEIFGIFVDLDGAANQTCHILTAADELYTNDSADATDTLTGALTAANFGKTQMGSITGAVAPGFTAYCLWSSEITDSALPTAYVDPTGGGDPDDLGNTIINKLEDDGTYTEYELVRRVSAGVYTDLALDRYVSSARPDWLNPAGTGPGLVPQRGAIFGSTIPGGISLVENVTKKPLGVVRMYKTGTWTTGVTSNERSVLERAGKPRIIANYCWKVPGAAGWDWASAIANPTVINQNIDNMCTEMKKYGHKWLFCPYHEPEDNADGTSGWTTTDYIVYFRHIVQRCKANNLNAEYVVNYVGNVGNKNKIIGMYPGDDVVDHIWWDPYAHGPDDHISDLMNENWGTPGQGFYYWATHASTLAAGGGRPTAFAGNKPLGVGETGWDRGPRIGLDDGDAQAAEGIDTVAPNLQSTFTKIKYWMLWNSDTLGDPTKDCDYRIQTIASGAGSEDVKTLTQAAMVRMLAHAHFNQVSTNDAP